MPFTELKLRLADLQQSGKFAIRYFDVTVAQLEVARSIAPIVSVQNLYSLRKEPAKMYSPRASVLEFFCPGIPWAANAA